MARTKARKTKKPTPVPQASVVPYRLGDAGIEFCLITSRRSGRWGFPKGYAREMETTHGAALNEAWEEAGLTGKIVGDRLGSYRYSKNGIERDVEVLLMEVASCEDDWKESRERQRSWASADEALQLISRPNLTRFLRHAIDRVNALPENRRHWSIRA